MNEEELKKGCGKELKRKAFESPSLSLYCGIEIFVSESVGLKVILCPTCKAKLEYFQKGKLEILNKLNETYPDLKTQEDRKIFVKWKEQLQKEIGGNEK